MLLKMAASNSEHQQKHGEGLAKGKKKKKAVQCN